MNVFAKFDEIPPMILEVIKETKCYGHTFLRSDVSDGQRENSIPSHKHSLRGGIIFKMKPVFLHMSKTKDQLPICAV